MTMNRANSDAILTPEQIGTLVVQPVIAGAVATQVGTVVTTSAQTYRIPAVTADPSAEWVGEGDEITPANMTFAEIDVVPAKLAGLSIITNELADDSSPAAAAAVGEGLARDIARKLDAAFFGSKGVSTVQPAGLQDLVGVQVIDTGAGVSNTDPFAEALSKAETVGATITAWVTDPATALALAKVKKATGSNEPLLGADPTSPSKRTVLGVPLYVTPAVTAGNLWAIPASRATIVVRDNTRLEVDRSPFFTSDQTAVKATMRVAFAYPHPAAIVRLHSVPAWAASTTYAAASNVKVGAGILQATVAGTSAASAPTLPGSVGGTVTDGGVTWRRIS